MIKFCKKGIIIILAFALMLASVSIYSPKEEIYAAKGKVTSVKVTNVKNKKLNLETAKTFKLKVSVKGKGKISKAVSFKSSNKKIVTVSKKGNLKAVKEGTATITVTSKVNKKKNIKIKVTVTGAKKSTEQAKPISKIDFGKSETVLYVGQSETLIPTIEPAESTDKLVWSSSDEAVATVSNGTIKAIAPGNVIIKARSSENSSVEGSIVVSVKKNSVKSFNVTNPTTVEVEFYAPVELTKESFKIFSVKQIYYPSFECIDFSASADKKKYTLIFETSFIDTKLQLIVDGIDGEFYSIYKGIISDEYLNYEYFNSHSVNETVKEYVNFNAYGKANIAISNLPEGVKYIVDERHNTVYFYGILKSFGVTETTIVLKDSIGNTFTKVVEWVVGNGTSVCACAEKKPEDPAKVYGEGDGAVTIAGNTKVYLNGGADPVVSEVSCDDANIYDISWSDEGYGKFNISYKAKKAGTYNLKIAYKAKDDSSDVKYIDCEVLVNKVIKVSGYVKDVTGKVCPLTDENASIYFIDYSPKSDVWYEKASFSASASGYYEVYLLPGTYDIELNFSRETEKYISSVSFNGDLNYDITLSHAYQNKQ